MPRQVLAQTTSGLYRNRLLGVTVSPWPVRTLPAVTVPVPSRHDPMSIDAFERLVRQIAVGPAKDRGPAA